MDLEPILQGLVLLLVANGTPVVATRLLGSHAAWPLDGGLVLADGRPLLGSSKTVRGVLLGVMATALAASLLGLGWTLGALLGAAAMAGDLLSSFIKRRMGLAPSSQAVGLDHVPEGLLPLFACRAALGLSLPGVLLTTLLFWLGSVILSRALFALKIRDRPY